jgi:hypothetical protein
MKKIKSIIVLLFVLFSIQAIAQATYKVEPNGTIFRVSRITYGMVDGVISPNDATIGNKNNLTDVISCINSDATSNNYTSYDLVFNGNLDFSGQSLITLTPTLTTINGTLTVGTVNIGSITVNGTLNTNILTIDNGETLTVDSYKILKVAASYTNHGIEDFLPNSIIIGISRNYPLTLSLNDAKWNFVGFPTNTNLSFLTASGMPEDIWAIRWDYPTNTWYTDVYLHAGDNISRGNGILIFPDGAVSTNLTFNTDNTAFNMDYPDNSASQKWFALANPFTHDISITKFKNLHTNLVQGSVVYTYNGTTFTYQSYGFINPLQGFIVQAMNNNTTINFQLDKLYYQELVKSENATENNIDIDVLTDDYAVPVTFLHKETALAEYDIFDADKMFGSGAVAEPYFVLGERNLCIEAANTLPYTAPMNIKSGEARNVQIVVSHIPEQYEVTLVDGEEEIALEAGVAYETMIASGENEDRFKVIINKKNSVSISDVENVSEISLRQYNRNIIIEGGKNIYTEIFNMLGQKVYETADRNFMLNKVDAGAYVVKVKDGNSVSATKIVVK